MTLGDAHVTLRVTVDVTLPGGDCTEGGLVRCGQG
jgi:hypothetical protein